jgi:hypothetical protein
MNEMIDRSIDTVPGVLPMTPDGMSGLAAIDIRCDISIPSTQKTEELQLIHSTATKARFQHRWARAGGEISSEDSIDRLNESGNDSIKSL